MGITIHYHGKLANPRALDALLDDARLFCRARGWEWQDIDDRVIGTVERWMREESKGEQVVTRNFPIDDTLRGIIVNPHPESEGVWLIFNGAGELCSYMPQNESDHYWENKFLFTKTQFAPIENHIAVCELLEMIRDKHFPTLEVSDEGEYWQTKDRARLEQQFALLNSLMNRVEKMLKDPERELSQEIQKTLDEKDAGEVKKKRGGKKEPMKVERGAKLAMPKPLWKSAKKTRASRN